MPLPPEPGLALMPASEPFGRRALEEIEASDLAFSYVCRRCDVWGRVPPGGVRRCWACGRNDRLNRR